jgi:hypothetical protein
MNVLKLLAVTLFCLVLTSEAEAKWWIFGQANEEVSISYLYLNDISYEESGQKLTLYRDMLTGGEIVLRGKARVSKGNIGGASVSLDNRATWKEAQFSTDGAFEYRFRPEVGKTYVMYVEVVDTSGKANDIENTRKELTVSEGSFQNQVRETLDAMIAAYRAEDPAAFMKYVSEDFAADPSVLDRAIRRDFAIFDNIDLRYTLNNVASGSGGLFTSISFSRQLTSARDGKTYTDKGVTEFVFRLTDQGAKVFSMKFPLIFGLSDSAEIATGTANSGSNEPTIVVSSSGDVALVPLSDALAGNDSISSVESGSATIAVQFHPALGFDFVSGEVRESGVAFMMTGGDATQVAAYVFLQAGTLINDLGSSVPISSLSQAPDSGYGSGPATGGIYLVSGHSYAFLLSNGKYALMQVTNVTFPGSGYDIITTMQFSYKYQPDGSRNF